MDKISKQILRFLLTKQVFFIVIIAALVITVTRFVPFEKKEAGISESQPTAGSSTPATEQVTVEEPTVYPEETVAFQLPDITTSYLQTDIYTTVDNNIFMDALVYTGYNITKHRADGKMWEYILSADKAGLGYLSKISYGDGCTGYETNDAGKPDIARFEEGNLVCASFVTYVYFNYLPNVAGIDTSALTRPDRSYNADSFYTAAKDWVEKGYCRYISFDYKVLGALGSSFIEFTPSENIPIGSLVILCNPKTSMTAGSHVAIYAGHVNGYDWLYHVGTKNGPEFSAIQRMNFGPNARWPIAVITPPNNIRFTPVLEIALVDKTGKPISGSEFILKHPTSGKEISLGATDADGKIIRTDLSYGDFELIQVVPDGYSCKSTSNPIKITGVNNSYNKIRVVNTKTKS